MSDFLPTPRSQNAEARNSKLWVRPDGEPQNLENALARLVPTSASSPVSEGWISRWKRRGIPASDRSSGTPTAPESSSDGGRLFPVGEMSPRSERRSLPTPRAAFDRPTRIEGSRVEKPSQFYDRISSSVVSPASPPLPPADGREPPTIAGSGRRSPVSLASYDPELSSWRTSQVSLLSTEDERFPRSSERWPTSGMTRRGRAFALPMSGPVTSGSGSSSLLQTPNQNSDHSTQYSQGGYPLLHQLLHTPTTGDTVPNYDHRASPGYMRAIPVPNLAAQIEDELLPTPRHEGFDAGNHRGQPDSLNQTIRMLPTPKTPTGGPEKRAGRKARGLGGEDLEASLRSLGEPTNPPSEGGSE